MPRPAGIAKTGGRKAGTPNRIKSSATELLNEYGFDPLRGMMAIAADNAVNVAIRARLLGELAQYVYPKRRAVEISGIDGAAIEVSQTGTSLESLEARIAGIAERIRAKTGTQPT